MARTRNAVFMGLSMAGSGAKVKRADLRGQAGEKNFPNGKFFFGIPQMGDAEVKKCVTFASTLETRKQIPDVHCAPLGFREKRRSFPYRTMGMGGLIFSAEVFPKIIAAYPKWVMRLSQSAVTFASTLETRKQVPDVHCAPLGIRKTPLIPISDHGNGRLSRFGGSSAKNIFFASPKRVMKL
jgi:hypothetical protein